MKYGPLVSVVIPTLSRRDLLARALRSVRAQTYTNIQIVIVVDSDVFGSRSFLPKDVEDCVVFYTGKNVGASSARNAGVRAACGELIAFLDDDDEWLPEKLERQVALYNESKDFTPVVASRVILRHPDHDLVWPRAYPEPGEPLSEYLFCRRGLLRGHGALQTSMLLMSRKTALELPFPEGLRRHTDTAWFLEAARRPGLQFVFVPQALTIWHVDLGRSRISLQYDWQSSLAWADRYRALMTERSYAAFLLTAVGSDAACSRQYQAFLPILRKAGSAYRMGWRELLSYFALWLTTPRIRRVARVTHPGPEGRHAVMRGGRDCV